MELKEQELLELIKGGEKIVLRVWMNNCNPCKNYEPVFEKVASLHPELKFVSTNIHELPKSGSVFKRQYMMLGEKEKADVPATMIFVGGEMKARKWGAMSEGQLIELVKSEKAEEPKPDYRAEIINLFSQKGEIVHICQKHQKQIDSFSAKLMEVDKRIIELEEILGAPNAN